MRSHPQRRRKKECTRMVELKDAHMATEYYDNNFATMKSDGTRPKGENPTKVETKLRWPCNGCTWKNTSWFKTNLSTMHTCVWKKSNNTNKISVQWYFFSSLALEQVFEVPARTEDNIATIGGATMDISSCRGSTDMQKTSRSVSSPTTWKSTVIRRDNL